LTYRVIWTPGAESDLARLWIETAGRDEVTQASNHIDRLLYNDAHLQGESREGFSRVLFVLPFGVDFDVIEVAATVFVTGFWKVKSH
jgi:hypothetical protein